MLLVLIKAQIGRSPSNHCATEAKLFSILPPKQAMVLHRGPSKNGFNNCGQWSVCRWGIAGNTGGEPPKESHGRVFFFFVVHLPPLFSFSSWAASWQKLSTRVKRPPMTWSTLKMWRRAVTNTRPCVRFVRATPNNVLMSLSPCETGWLLLPPLPLHDKEMGRWWIRPTERFLGK